VAKRWGKSADELLRELEADPNWVAAQESRKARHRMRLDAITVDIGTVLADLQAIGENVSSLAGFVNGTAEPTPSAMKVLVRHLDVEHHPAVHNSLIRALSISTAKDAAFKWLYRRFPFERDPNVKWLIANALSAMARFHELRDLPGIEEYRMLFPKE
jgi:hypothetical protein